VKISSETVSLYVHTYILKDAQTFPIIELKVTKLLEHLEEAGDQELSVCAFVVNNKL